MVKMVAGYLKWLCAALSVAMTRQTVVMTAQGALRGEEHHGYISYRGIPYASIRDTDAKFKRAGLAPTWSGVRESQVSSCSWSSSPEECLVLDVHVPTTGQPWPVLTWIRGGSGWYSPGKLVQQGLIVVIISHRLGPSGFLCLGDERIPGNAGVKDAVLALRWVRDNIAAFQGNPHNVVVGGQGFAAAMVEALLLTPMAQNLFHGAIMQSGSILCPWAFNYDAKERALTLSQMLDDNEPATLMKVDITDLAEKTDKINVPYIPFGLCAEKGFKREERLLSDAPHRLLSSKFSRRVPLIVGFNSDEAYIFLSLLRQRNLRRKIAKNLSILLPEELKFFNEVELKNVVKQVQDNYFKNNFSIAAMLTYHRDAYFTNHIIRSVRFHASSSFPVYLYQFSYAGEPGVHPDYGIRKTGAAHSDELAYLFPETLRDFDGEDGIVQQNLISLWTNFVKHLVPTLPDQPAVSWEPADASDLRLLDISKELKMKEFPGKMTSMWNDIYERFYYARSQGH